MELLRKIIQEAFKDSMFNWKKHYPQLEIVGDKVRLYHFGPAGISKLDPIKAKKNVHDYTPDFNFWSEPRVFFYTKLKDKEPRVSGHLYTIEYPLDRLYPINLDPLKLKEKYCKGKDDAIGTYCYLDAVKRNYDGYISQWDNKLRAEIWVPVSIPKDQQHKKEKTWIYAQHLNKYLNDDAYKMYKRWENNLEDIFPNDEELIKLNKMAKVWKQKGMIKD